MQKVARPKVYIADMEHQINNKLYFWCPLQEGGGTQVFDISQRKHVGTFAGLTEADWVISEEGDYALDFEAADASNVVDFLSSDDFQSPPGNKTTLSFWVMVESNPANACPISNWTWTTPEGWAIQFKSTNIEFVMSDGGSSTRTATSVLAGGGEWQHIVITYNGDISGNDKVHMFIDGVEPSSYTDAGTINSTMPNTAAEFHFGDFPGLGRYYDGLLKNVRWWRRELRHYEIYQLFTNPWIGLLDPFEVVPGIAAAAASTVPPLFQYQARHRRSG